MLKLSGIGDWCKALEVGYWHDFNDFKLALRTHVEERDGLVVNIEQTVRQLERQGDGLMLITHLFSEQLDDACTQRWLQLRVDEEAVKLCEGDPVQRLRRTNVYNDAFHIWFDGPFGMVYLQWSTTFTGQPKPLPLCTCDHSESSSLRCSS